MSATEGARNGKYATSATLAAQEAATIGEEAWLLLLGRLGRPWRNYKLREHCRHACHACFHT